MTEPTGGPKPRKPAYVSKTRRRTPGAKPAVQRRSLVDPLEWSARALAHRLGAAPGPLRLRPARISPSEAPPCVSLAGSHSRREKTAGADPGLRRRSRLRPARDGENAGQPLTANSTVVRFASFKRR